MEPEEEFCDDCGDSIGQEPWDFLCYRCREIIEEQDLLEEMPGQLNGRASG